MECRSVTRYVNYAAGADTGAGMPADMMMPIMDGMATIHALEAINPKVRVIAASGHLWGSTVNLAYRMESSGVPGRIQVPQATQELLRESFILTERGMVDCKGLGAIQTYFLDGKRRLSCA